MGPTSMSSSSWVTGFNLATKRSVSCELRDLGTSIEKSLQLSPKKMEIPKTPYRKKRHQSMEFLRESTEDANKKSPFPDASDFTSFFQERFLGLRFNPQVNLRFLLDIVCLSLKTMWLLLLKQKQEWLFWKTESESKNHVELPNLSTKKQTHKASAQQFCKLQKKIFQLVPNY